MSFSNADLLPRRLTPEGCRVATAQLQAAVAQLQSEKIAIPGDVRQATDAVVAAEEPLRSAPGEVPMNRLDNVADGCVGGIAAVLNAHEQALLGAEWVQLSSAEQKRLQAVRSLRAAILPSGTGFLHSNYRVQWERMETMVAELHKDDWKPLLEPLGLTLLVGRLVRLTELYGARLGITKIVEEDEDEMAKALDRWHDAMGDVVIHTRKAFHDGNNEQHARARKLLLAAYEQQASSERSAEQSRRRSKKEDPTT